jgi:uncharacterized protein (DUF4415 family)
LIKRYPTTDKFVPGQGFSQEDWDEVSDNHDSTPEELAQARPFVEVFPELAESIRRARGRPKIDAPKQAVTLRLDPQALARFKASGKDWRARMAEILEKAEV